MKKRILLTTICLILGAVFLSADEAAPLDDGLYAKFSTPRGELRYRLDYENLPLTVSNFVAQAEEKMDSPLFQDLSFYRMVSGYALFSGDKDGTGRGGADYTFPRESGGIYSSTEPGALMMESQNGEDHGSRFLILIGGDSFLDTKYTVFGQLQSDPQVLNKIKKGDSLSIEIVRIGSQAEKFAPGKEDVTALISQAKEESRLLFSRENPQVAAVLDALGEGIEKTETGIYYKVLQKGDGAMPRPGNTVQMHYSGRLISGQEFDNSYVRGEPFSFTLGKDGVIPGWIETALSMQPGEKRVILLPPELAYGERGYGPIPPESWLIFEIELIDFQ